MGDFLKLDDMPPLGFTERELFSIYMKYSESSPEPNPQPVVTHSQEENLEGERVASTDHHSPRQRPVAGVGSSPMSHNDNDHDSSQMTCSTTHTTPLKHWMMRDEVRPQTQDFEILADLSACDLPHDLVTYLRSLASQIVEIGGYVQTHRRRGDKEGAEEIIFEEIGVLMQLLESSIKNCSDQIDNINWIKGLAAFTLVPTDMALRSLYRQRAELVARHLAVPSLTEYNLLESLNHLHDAYVSVPFIQLTKTTALSPQTMFPDIIRNAVVDLTVTLHSLLTTYKSWLRSLHRLRTDYMTPLLRRIQASPWVRREIEQAEVTIEMARLRLHKRYESGEMRRILQEDQLRGAEMLVDRRSKSSVLPGTLDGRDGLRVAAGGAGNAQGQGPLARRGTRARREHTM